jgi:hypothetical protein
MEKKSTDHGLRAVTEALRAEDFPMAKIDINYSVGDMTLDAPDGGRVPVRDLVDRLPRESFGSAEDVVRALQGELQYWSKTGRKAA